MSSVSIHRPTTALLSSARAGVLVVAHRGCWTSAPENSLAALESAIALGVDIVEIDVQSTRDGVLLCLHDDTIERTTDGDAEVVLSDYDALRRHRLRQGRGDGRKPLTDEPIPLLTAVLDAARDRVLLNLDIKTGDLADRVAELVIAAGMADQVIMKSAIDGEADFQRATTRRFFGRIAFMPIVTARAGRFAADLARLEPLRPMMVEVNFDDLAELEAGRAELARQGMRLWINTLDVFHNLDLNDTRALADPDAVWGRLIAAGTGALQTDESATLIDYLQRGGHR